MSFTSFMDIALEEARSAALRGEIPVGAALIDPATNAVIARAGNRSRELLDPSAHAEILAIRAASQALRTDRLPGLDLYVTLEPCPACAAIISAARIGRLYYGASDPKSGGIEQGPRIFTHAQSHHKPQVYGGIRELECAAVLTDFFTDRR